MTDPERPVTPSTARQEEATAAWLRSTLERSRRPWSQETRRRLAALRAPFGDTRNPPSLPAGQEDTRGSRGDHRRVRVGRIDRVGGPGSGRGDGV